MGKTEEMPKVVYDNDRTWAPHIESRKVTMLANFTHTWHTLVERVRLLLLAIKLIFFVFKMPFSDRLTANILTAKKLLKTIKKS